MKTSYFIVALPALIAMSFSVRAATTDGFSKAPDGEPSQLTRAQDPHKTPENIFESLSNAGFSLSRGSGKEEEGEPAEFGFIDDIGKSTEVHANFFLQYKYKDALPLGESFLTPLTSAEGHVSSADNKANDAWRFRAGLEWDVPFGATTANHTNPHTGHNEGPGYKDWLYATLSYKFEANRDFNVTKHMAELEITPSIPALFIGTRASDALIDQNGDKYGHWQQKRPPLDFRWRPYFDVDAGKTADDGTTTAAGGVLPVEMNHTILRLRPRAHVDVWLNFLKDALAFESVRAFADCEYSYLPLEDTKRNHRYFQTGVVFGFNKNVGFNLTYTTGENSPEFHHDHTLTGSLTVGF
jgi:hypothetical protein